jgi:hypothetical protein
MPQQPAPPILSHQLRAVGGGGHRHPGLEDRLVALPAAGGGSAAPTPPSRTPHHLAVAAQSLRPPRAGMPVRNSEAVRQRAIDAAHQRSGQPVTSPWTRCSWPSIPGALLARDRPAAELSEWVRRDEEYAILGANVVELYSESHGRRPTTRGLGGHPSRRVQLPIGQQCASRHYPDRIDCASRPQQPQEREEVADPR